MFAVYYYVTVLLSLSLLALTDSFQQKMYHGCRAIIAREDHIQYMPDSTMPLFLSRSTDSGSKKDYLNSICVLIESSGDDDDDDDDGGGDKKIDSTLREDALTIANSLNVPLLSALDRGSMEESNSCETIPFSHALKLVPYDYGNNLSTFALAIEPIAGSENEAPENGKGRRSKAGRRPKKKSKSSPAFFVDLCPPANSKAGRRASGASGKADLLVKAVGPRKGQMHPSDGSREGAVIWDLTAGLGQDSLVLARSGAKRVHMVERHPVVAALLQDAMRRLELLAAAEASVSESESEIPKTKPEGASSENTAGALLETLGFSIGEGMDILKEDDRNCDGPVCDVVYLDPMFPPRQKNKQSAVKKGMSVLHGLLETHVASSEGNSESDRQREEQDLLKAALEAAKLRVVVKRPVKAPLLGDGSTKPSHTLAGSFNRWDVYVKPPLLPSSPK